MQARLKNPAFVVLDATPALIAPADRCTPMAPRQPASPFGRATTGPL